MFILKDITELTHITEKGGSHVRLRDEFDSKVRTITN